MATVADATERRDALVGRLFMDAVGAFDLFSVYLGDRLGLYRALADKGPLTSAELAEAAGIHERYAREWLEQQAASDPRGRRSRRRTRAALPPARRPRRGAARRRRASTTSRRWPAPWSPRPPDRRSSSRRSEPEAACRTPTTARTCTRARRRFTRPLFENLLGKEWLAVGAGDPRAAARRSARAGRRRRLRARPLEHRDRAGLPEGAGRRDRLSTRASIEPRARTSPASGVEDRVTFHDRDAADAGLAGRYDLVTIFEALHDMSYPVDVLRAARGLLADGGVVFVGDERTEESLHAPAGETRAPLLRLQHPPLPARGHGRRGRGRDRHRDSGGHRQGVRGAGRVLELRGAADRERLLALLPASSVVDSAVSAPLATRAATRPPLGASGRCGRRPPAPCSGRARPRP